MSEWIKLKDVCVINYGKSPNGFIRLGASIPIVGTGGVERYADDYVYNGESIILGRKGTLNNPIFISGKFWPIDTTFYLSDFKDINVKYLYYYLLTARLENLNESTGVPRVSRDSLYGVSILCKTLAEQARIAHILGTADAAIAHTEALIAKYGRVRTGLMQDLLTHGIDEHGQIRTEATHEFKGSPLCRVPVEWEVVSLKGIGDVKTPYLKTGPFGSSLKISDWVDYGVPVVTIGSLGDNDFIEKELLHIGEKKANELSSYRLNVGDLVFSRVAGVGRSLVIKELQEGLVMSSNFMRIRLNPSLYSFDFLHLIVKYSDFLKVQQSRFVNSSGRTVVNSSILNSFHFPQPALSEQLSILDRINKLTVSEENLTLNLAKLQTLKKALMQDLLSGPGA